MEIEQIRQELNHLLDSVVEHSENYSNNRQIPSLEISVVLAKINKMQENLAVLRHLLRDREMQLKAEQKNRKQQASLAALEEHQKTEGPLSSTSSVDESNEENSSVVEKIQQKPINSLADAFNLNDRYLYANELFNKDMNAFNQLIKAIDDSSSIEDAQNLINRVKERYGWGEENQITLDFMDLIERRFI